MIHNSSKYYTGRIILVRISLTVAMIMMSISRGVRSFTVSSSGGTMTVTRRTGTTRSSSSSSFFVAQPSKNNAALGTFTRSHTSGYGYGACFLSTSGTADDVTMSSSTTSTSPTNPISLDVCQELLQTAEEAARAAGRIIVDNLGCPVDNDDENNDNDSIEQKFNIKDVVTKHDKAAQYAIKTTITQKYPGHTFLGEEDVPPGAQASEDALVNILASMKKKQQQAQHDGDNDNDSDNAKDNEDDGFIWICDPIDGTANFASGMPLCGVTVTVIHDNQAIIGVIYDPHRDELFYSIRDHGAFLVEKKKSSNMKRQLRVQSSVGLAKDAIVNAGCPADRNAFEASMRGVMALNSQVRGLRIIAASCITLAWIASGRLTAHFGYDLSGWDLVAGALIIQEAGGRITDIDGSPYKITTRNMLCSNGQEQVHDEILQILKDADATTFVRSE
mmetsp:Transcript_8742/g.21935  ORF Transcript_8742/g.21935 Transcript_8742/m.21935 type:complete len:446 (-) Transcript_8742:450-1787(-)